MSILFFKLILSLVLHRKSENKTLSYSCIRKSPRATLGITDKDFWVYHWCAAAQSQKLPVAKCLGQEHLFTQHGMKNCLLKCWVDGLLLFKTMFDKMQVLKILSLNVFVMPPSSIFNEYHDLYLTCNNLPQRKTK